MATTTPAKIPSLPTSSSWTMKEKLAAWRSAQAAQGSTAVQPSSGAPRAKTPFAARQLVVPPNATTPGSRTPVLFSPSPTLSPSPFFSPALQPSSSPKPPVSSLLPSVSTTSTATITSSLPVAPQALTPNSSASFLPAGAIAHLPKKTAFAYATATARLQQRASSSRQRQQLVSEGEEGVDKENKDNNDKNKQGTNKTNATKWLGTVHRPIAAFVPATPTTTTTTTTVAAAVSVPPPPAPEHVTDEVSEDVSELISALNTSVELEGSETVVRTVVETDNDQAEEGQAPEEDEDEGVEVEEEDNSVFEALESAIEADPSDQHQQPFSPLHELEALVKQQSKEVPDDDDKDYECSSGLQPTPPLSPLASAADISLTLSGSKTPLVSRGGGDDVVPLAATQVPSPLDDSASKKEIARLTHIARRYREEHEALRFFIEVLKQENEESKSALSDCVSRHRLELLSTKKQYEDDVEAMREEAAQTEAVITQLTTQLKMGLANAIAKSRGLEDELAKERAANAELREKLLNGGKK